MKKLITIIADEALEAEILSSLSHLSNEISIDVKDNSANFDAFKGIISLGHLDDSNSSRRLITIATLNHAFCLMDLYQLHDLEDQVSLCDTFKGSLPDFSSLINSIDMPPLDVEAPDYKEDQKTHNRRFETKNKAYMKRYNI